MPGEGDAVTPGLHIGDRVLLLAMENDLLGENALLELDLHICVDGGDIVLLLASEGEREPDLGELQLCGFSKAGNRSATDCGKPRTVHEA